MTKKENDKLRVIDKVYKDYKNLVNMTFSELKNWKKIVKKNGGGLRDINRNLELLRTPKKNWKGKEIRQALSSIKILRKNKRKLAKKLNFLKNNAYNPKKTRKARGNSRRKKNTRVLNYLF